ncbi:hypothetical protein [Enterococcus crotali]|uniref:hypothetical protein n=1 Tax=Enterococcus crotali TaxID=1453587 RepID=UPI000470AD30|nr:hypothetical protein [Enterococcus crotali]
MNRLIEEHVLQAVEGYQEDSFMYLLHEKNYIDLNAFKHLITLCEQLIDFYKENGKTENYVKVIRMVLDRFEYILMNWSYHLSENDLFYIKNFQEMEENENILLINDEIRRITGLLIF